MAIRRIILRRAILQEAGYGPEHAIWRLLGERNWIEISTAKLVCIRKPDFTRSFWRIPDIGCIPREHAQEVPQ